MVCQPHVVGHKPASTERLRVGVGWVEVYSFPRELLDAFDLHSVNSTLEYSQYGTDAVINLHKCP